MAPGDLVILDQGEVFREVEFGHHDRGASDEHGDEAIVNQTVDVLFGSHYRSRACE